MALLKKKKVVGKKTTTSKARKRRRKRKKGGHYKTGVHSSPKCPTPFKYRSGWELSAALWLDQDPTVKSYEYETLKIPYMANKRTKKMRNYIPDFLVEFHDGRKLIVEIKRSSALEQLIIMKKAHAATEYATKNGWKYAFWTEKVIFPMQKIQDKALKEQVAEATQKKKKKKTKQ